MLRRTVPAILLGLLPGACLLAGAPAKTGDKPATRPAAKKPRDNLELWLGGGPAKPAEPVNPLAMVLSYGASFVARGFSGKPKELTEILKAAVLHDGFSFVQVISPCTTFYDTYSLWRERVEPVPDEHDVTDRAAAFRLALEVDRGYIGLFYREERPSFEDQVAKVVAEPSDSYAPMAISGLLDRFRR